MAAILTPEEFESFQNDLYQLILSEAGGEIDSEKLQLKLEILLEKYLGPYSQSRSDFQNLAEQFADTAIEELIQQVVSTDTAGLPNVIINFLSKRDVNID